MIEDPDIQNFLAIFMEYQTQYHAKMVYQHLTSKYFQLYKSLLPLKIRSNLNNDPDLCLETGFNGNVI